MFNLIDLCSSGPAWAIGYYSNRKKEDVAGAEDRHTEGHYTPGRGSGRMNFRTLHQSDVA